MDISMLKLSEIKEAVAKGEKPPCLGHYLQRGNEVSGVGDAWCHYCSGSALDRAGNPIDNTTCPYSHECWALRNQDLVKSIEEDNKKRDELWKKKEDSR